jgi:molecular chaperone DnaK (HSP70)
MVLIGVDFGTTYCCMAYCNNGNIEVITDNEGNKLIPTCISFIGNNILYGKFALYNREYYPKSTITNIKRFIARNDINVDMPYGIEYDNKNRLMIVINQVKPNEEYDEEKKVMEKKFYPSEIVSKILSYLKTVAESYLSLSVTGIVLTAPAYFDDLQKRILYEAGKEAGIDIRQIISEPTAAALCYKTDNQSNVLVYDIGGGTLDITLLTCQGNNYVPITKRGDSKLGGINFTAIIEEFLINEFLSKNPSLKGILSDARKLAKIRTHAEAIKIQLSNLDSLNIVMDSFYKKQKLEINLSRLKFESLCKLLFDKCDETLDSLLRSITPQTIVNDLIFIGGSSRIPKIRENTINLIMKRQNIKPNIHNNINPDEAVAIGACKQAYSLSNPIDLNSINLSEIVPENIGIQVGSDVMDVIFEKNTKIPCSKNVEYGTYYNNQTKMKLKMYQGDDPKVKFNKLIGLLEINNLQPRPKGEIRVILSIQLLKNGMLKLNAFEKESNKTHETMINNLLEVEHSSKIISSNIEIFKKIKRIIINKNVTDHKYLEFVNEMDKKDITVLGANLFNDILNELNNL